MKIFENKTYLITGGTGSFGSAMVRNLLKKKNIKEIRVFSRDENKQEKLRLELNSKKIKFFIGDIRNFSSILQIAPINLILNSGSILDMI